MSQREAAPEARFDAIVEALLGTPGVTPPEPEGGSRKFGSSGLKVNGKIFAMLVRGDLVVKLPKKRVDTLIASGEGEHFDPRHDGRLMQEWLVLDSASSLEWLELAKEAMQFVGGPKRS